MANFNDIKHEIDQNVNTNGVQAITGAILNETLKDMIDEVDEKKQDTLVAGQNITIQGNVISATGGGSGTTYEAGHGIDINHENPNDVISVDTAELAGVGLNNVDNQFNVNFDVVQSKLTAGANIHIYGNTISSDNTTYSAGQGLSLNGITFSVDSSSLAGSGLEVDESGALKTDPSVVQEKLTAGDGLEIDQNNEISVKAGTGLGFDSNGYLINTGGGGGGTTYTAGDGIEIDSSDAINAKLGNGLQLDQNNSIEIDPSVVATQTDLQGKEDALTEGQGINIDSNNVISVDASDLAGNGLQVNQSGYLEPDFSVVASKNDLQGKQDTLVAGANITINGNTISATDTNTTYSAGSGLNLNGTTFSVDTSAIQEKLTAGTGISINGTTISATGGGGGATYSAGNGINIDQNNEISIKLSDIDGFGLGYDNLGQLNVYSYDLAGNGLQVDNNGALEVVGGGSSLWTTGAGAESRISSPNIAGSAAGDYALAGGWNPTATGDYSFAYGNRPTTTGDNGVAMGYQPTAGTGSVALGYIAQATGQTSFAAGHNTTASGIDSVAIGPGATSSAGYATAIGNGASAAGTNSVALGNGTQTTNTDEQAFGKYNKSYNSALTDTATSFSVGNGASNGARSNALEIKQNGDAYLVGVGGFDGTNSASSITLQDAINNGGGGQSYSAGNGIDIDQNNEISVDTTYLDGKYLPLQGGALQEDAAGVDRTQLIILSPGDSDVSIAAEVSQDEANTQISLENNAVYETEPGQGESITDITINNNSETGFALGIASHFVDDNGDWVRDDFESGEFFYSPAGQAVPAEIHLDTSSSNLSDPGNETSEAKITIQDDRGYVEFNPTGFYNGSYTLYYPSLSQDETIATLSDIQSGSYTAGSGIDITNDVISVDTTTIQGKLTAGANIQINGNTISATDTNTTYSAGNGLNLNGTTFSADTTVLQEKLTAGSNITISGNVISATGGGGASYSAGSGIDITNNTISVDNTIATVSDLQGYLPLEGGTLQNSASEPETRLELVSPVNGDCSVIAYANEIDSETTLSLNSSSVSEREPGLFASSSDLIINSGGKTGLDLFASASYVEDNGTYTLDEFYSSASVYAPDGAAEILLETNSSSLSDPGNETREARLAISDDRGSIELNPTGFSDGTYSLSFPSLNQDETIATLSDIPSASSLAGDGLQDDGNGALEVKLGSGLQFDANGAIETTGGGGGSSYTAGTGINIDANNVISNTAPSLWLSGNGSHSVKLNSSLTTANGAYACSIGRYNHADGADSLAAGQWANATGQSSMALGDNSVSTGTYSAALGYFAQASNEGATAIGAQSYAKNQYEVGIGRYNNSINSGTTAEKTQFTVGCGTGANSTANLIEAKQNKDIYIYGVGGFTGTNASSASTLQTVISGKQDTLTAGTGISISGNVISATGGGGTTYSAGSGLNLNGTTFSVDTTTIQEKLTAGSGITISGNTISATGGGGGGSCLWSTSTGTNSLISPGAATGVSSDAAGTGAITIGYDATADGDYAFACGAASVASGDYSFAANNGTAEGDYSAAFSGSGAYGMDSFAAGAGSIAGPDNSVALGGGIVVFDDETDPQNPINAQYGVAIGDGSIVNGEYGTAIGAGVVEAGGNGSVAIGSGSTAAGLYDVAVAGGNSRGNYSFAASSGQTDSQGHYASALSGGYATGESSLASGQDTNAWGYSSIALGLGVNTYDQVDGSDRLDTNAGEVALGRYNYSESGIIFSIGCGYYDTEGDQEVHENAVAIDSDGKIYLKGLGGYTGQSVSGCTDLVSFLNNL